MKKIKKRKIIGASLFFVVAIVFATAGAVYSLVDKLRSDMENHFEVVYDLRMGEQLDQIVNELVLRAHSFTLDSYESLTITQKELLRLCDHFRSSQNKLLHSYNESVATTTEDFCRMTQIQSTAVSQFIVENQNLHLQLNDLPHLVKQITSPALRAMSSQIFVLLLRYQMDGNPELIGQINGQMRDMRSQLGGVHDAAHTRSAENLLLTASEILQGIDRRRSTENQILSRAIAISLVHLREAYLEAYQKKERIQIDQRGELLAFCVVLASILILIFVRLQKSRQALSHLNLVLEEKVSRRTQALATALRKLESQQQVLAHSTKMSALGEMAGGIAHEINTPLAAISINAELLINKARDTGREDLIDSLNKIVGIVDRISKIVVGLRRFSRDNSQDGQAVIKSRVSIQQIIEETLLLCQERFKNAQVKLTIHQPDEKILLNCVPEQISQVLLNLLNNSFDAVSDRQEKWVKIMVVTRGPALELKVVDSGPGIPLDLRHRIMQPFFTTKEVGKGTGIGLSISKGLIELHGGTLQLDDLSIHTTFVVTLPIAKEELIAA